MTRPALVLALLLGALLAAAAARADDEVDRPTAASTPSADRVVALALAAGAADVASAVLVGPSGQVYEPDGEGRWTRTRAGGVAGDVAGAILVDGQLVVAGRATPLYRRDAGTWFTLRVGEAGRTVVGRGPAPAVAVGKQVFVHTAKKWTRVGNLPGKVSAVWASGAKTVWAATDSGLYKLRGKSFVKAGATPRALVGATPWAIADGGVRDLAKDRAIAGEIDGAAITVVGAASASTGALHVVCETSTGALVLAAAAAGKLTRVDELPVTGRVAAVAVGTGGDVLVALADGTIAVWTGATWTTSKVEDDLPPARTGAAPARTR